MTTKLFHNVRVASLTDNGQPYGLIEAAAVRVDSGRISWVGKKTMAHPRWFEQDICIDCADQLLTPGLIDCHTHLVYAGNRAQEFEQRLNGLSYAEIAHLGGGINATVSATRAATKAQLLTVSLTRVDALLAEGVTTLEIKSGYGLTTADELKMLRVARQIEQQRAVNIKTSFLGAHSIPGEFNARSDAYIDLVCTQMLPAVAAHKLADAVDGFCEHIAFSTDQIQRVFQTAHHYKLPVKLHAEQLSLKGGAQLAAHFNALSADHLEYLDQAGIDAMKIAGTIAVLLPGAFYYLKETQRPPLDKLRQAGIPIAIATDCNPGSSPIHSLLLIMNMACTLFAMTPEEVLAAVTLNAAKALGIDAEVGTVEVGKRADFALWSVNHPVELVYQLGINQCTGRYIAGQDVSQRSNDTEVK